jgi:hypothetical protein
MASRCRFPPPWSVEQTDLLTRDEALRIAANIAKGWRSYFLRRDVFDRVPLLIADQRWERPN